MKKELRLNMSDRELYNKDFKEKTTSIFVRVSPEEKQLLDVKRKQYNYRYLSDYIRDASIYENIIVINLSSTNKMVDLFQTYIDEVRKYTKEVRRILKYATTINDDEKENLQQSLYKIYSSTKSLKNSINDNLDVEVIKKEAKERLYHQKIVEIEENYERINNNE